MTAKKCADALAPLTTPLQLPSRLEFLVQLWCITSIWPPNSTGILTRWELFNFFLNFLS